MIVSVIGDSQARRLGEVWTNTSHLSAWTVDYRCTKGGWTTAHLKAAVRKYTHVFHTHCVIFIGINDILHNFPHKVTKQNIKSIIHLLRKNNIYIFILTLPPTVSYTYSEMQRIQQFNVLIQSFSTSHQISVIPIHKQFFPFQSYNPSLYRIVNNNGTCDDIHLSRSGFRLTIETILVQWPGTSSNSQGQPHRGSPSGHCQLD